MSDVAFKTIQRECELVSKLETGGILVGYHVKGEIVIMAATGPGPNAEHSRNSLILDLLFIRDELKRYEMQPSIGYEGNWHSHPGEIIIRPSKTDELLLRTVVESPDYDVNRAVLIITSVPPRRIEDLHCFVFADGKRGYVETKPYQFRIPTDALSHST